MSRISTPMPEFTRPGFLLVLAPEEVVPARQHFPDDIDGMPIYFRIREPDEIKPIATVNPRLSVTLELPL